MAFGGRLEAFLSVPSGTSISATNSVGGPTTVAITAGSYTPTALLTHVIAQLNSLRPSGWSGSISTGAAGTGRATINCTNTPWSITWTSTNLRDALGFSVNISGVSVAQLAPKGIKGLWMPDCPLTLEGDPSRAPLVSDLRTSQSPRGFVIGLVGNSFYRHKNLQYSHVPRNRVHEAVAATINNTWETWVLDTQLGSGFVWFLPASAFTIYDHNEVQVGLDKVVTAWQLSGVVSVEPLRSGNSDWLGNWEVLIPQIVAVT